MSGDIFCCHNLGAGGVRGKVGVLLASSGWSPGMLVNILQPPNKEYRSKT